MRSCLTAFSTAALAILFSAGCLRSAATDPDGGIGSGNQHDGANNTHQDGNNTTHQDGGTTQTDGGTSSFACRPATSANGNGHHNAGADCWQCHSFTVAGTLYSSASGGSAVAGATITVVDANNQTLDLVTGTNGNFYTNSSVAFPIKLYASSCPTVNMMVSQMTSTNNNNGGCNQSSCHSSTRIHLP